MSGWGILAAALALNCLIIGVREQVMGAVIIGAFCLGANITLLCVGLARKAAEARSPQDASNPKGLSGESS